MSRQIHAVPPCRLHVGRPGTGRRIEWDRGGCSGVDSLHSRHSTCQQLSPHLPARVDDIAVRSALRDKYPNKSDHISPNVFYSCSLPYRPILRPQPEKLLAI